MALGSFAWTERAVRAGGAIAALPKRDSAVAALIIFLCYCSGKVIYNVFFHPLSRYPGPILAKITKIPMVLAKYRGDAHWFRRLHEHYGDTVRVAPNEISYTDPQAWKDIYGFRKGKVGNFPKDMTFYGPDAAGGGGLFRANDESHARQRRVFSNAFSEKALLQQEPILRRYVDLLVNALYDALKHDPDPKIDIERWYNFTTFDIMADLTFGEPLHLLEDQRLEGFVKNVTSFLKLQSLTQILRYYPAFKMILSPLFIPKSVQEKQAKHNQESINKVERRLNRNTERADIWSLVLNREGDQGLSVKEMHANGITFMAAGTETTATALTGLTYHLLTAPEKLKKLTTEIRSAFQKEEELTLSSLARLDYLAACFEEGLRMYPPVPNGPPRKVSKNGGIVCGHWLPEDTTCYVSSFAAYRSERYFKEPNSFIPERWLGAEEFASDARAVLQPFSTGPRNCLGKNLAYHEMRLILARVLWNFDLELCDESRNWTDQRVFVVWEKPPLVVRVRPAVRD
ncbi:cytochrome P450 [Hypoxylon cercidicola]|nr:cytochrome P450 [Hypoxylon cercidicola]